MMRYQRLSPNCIPLSNGKKPSLTPCKDDDEDDGESSGRIPSYIPSFKPPFSYSAAVDVSGGVCSGAGDGLLQWGHRKRSRLSRAESRPSGDESSGHSRRAIKIQRRAAAIAAMPPPVGPYTRGSSLRPCTPVLDSMAHVSMTVDERSSGQHRSERRSPAPSPYQAAGSQANGSTDETAVSSDLTKPAADPEATGDPAASALSAAEKLSLSHLEWPRIYVSLSRKEKEDDFLAMKGTKLPQRPKKRPKNIDKTLQYCFPGMWLSDLTRGRYEVREKKCVKKKRRGLKWMESMESDSE